MSSRTGIEWTDATWNPVVGCEQVSPGCGLCYAKTLHDMRHKAYLEGKDVPEQYRLPFESVQLMPERLLVPLRWKKPRKIFVNSVSDLFHESIPDAFLDQVFVVMAYCRRHTFQVLTKRPERMRAYLNAWRAIATDEALQERWDVARKWLREHIGATSDGRAIGRALRAREYIDVMMADTWHNPLPNLVGCVSVEDQKRANERIPVLLETWLAVRGISAEPLLSAVQIPEYLPNPLWNDLPSWRSPTIDWVIAGGESGLRSQRVRPMHARWAMSLRDQCISSEVPFLFKQHGDWLSFSADSSCITVNCNGMSARVDGRVYRGRDVRQLDDTTIVVRVGKKRAGRLLEGRTWDEFPRIAP